MDKGRPTGIWLKILAVLWMLWVFLDYWFKHPLYAKSFGSTFAGIPVMHLMIGGILFYLIVKLLKGRVNLFILIGGFLLFLWGGTLVNLFMYSDINYTLSGVFLYLGRSLLFVGVVLWVIWSAFISGNLLLQWLLPKKQDIASSISLALGLSLLIVFLFVSLVLGIFYWWSVSLLLILPFVINYKNFLLNFKALANPLPGLSDLSGLSVGCLLLIVLMNAITFGHTMSPFPVGFDALNYYINLPNLLAESGNLLKGFQPYNWSILQAAGVGLTNRIELALILSWMGLILVQWASFEIGSKLMKLPSDLILVGILLFSYMPSVSTQASQELKVDLGLTFMLLAIVLAGFYLMREMRASNRKSMVVFAVLIGVLGGIALGIKLTAVIALFAVIGLIWYNTLGRFGFVGIFFVCLALVFIVQLDTKAGLRSYHTSVSWLQYVLFLAGAAMLLFAAWKKKRLALKSLLVSSIIAIASVVFFSPWIIKNYSEIESPTFIQLLNGTSHGPQLNMKSIDKNLKKSRQ